MRFPSYDYPLHHDIVVTEAEVGTLKVQAEAIEISDE